MSVNLSSTTPAAPAGTVNGTFATDGSGNVSVSVPKSSSFLSADSIDLVTQAANIAATNLVATPVNGMYRVSAYIVVTRAASSSSTLPSVVITWTDQDNGQSQSLTLTPTNAGNVLTTFQEAVGVISVNVAAAIKYATSSYASSGGTPMQYALHIRVEAL